MSLLEQTWRWFGPNDPVTLEEIGQAGATGVVSALHHIPPGDPWPVEEILKRKQLVESAGLRWSVAESLPVHEEIKTHSREFRRRIDAYKESIRNLGHCGIDTICYNFMPVLDWSRTDLQMKFKDGSMTTKFESTTFAAFDLFILKRRNAERAYSKDQVGNAESYFSSLDKTGRERLAETILLGFPGTEGTFTLEQFRDSLRQYEELGEKDLRENLRLFLNEIIPVAEESNVRMALHPDDPPWPLLGLPRIVCTEQDLDRLLKSVDSPSNGLTLCTGSLGASRTNDIPRIARRFARRIHFAHLRNVTHTGEYDFFEDNHLEGDIDLYAVMKELVLEQKRRNAEDEAARPIPMRPDHGRLMAADRLKPKTYPGYSLFGRMRALAELRGLERGIERSLGI